MTQARQRRLSKGVIIAAGAVILLCVAILTVSYALARAAKPVDDAHILQLQEKVTMDASLAPELAAEHDRITRARQARKAAIKVLSVILIFASAAFIGAAKWRISLDGRQPVPMNRLVPLASAPAVKAGATRSVPEEPDLSVVDQIVAQHGSGKEAAVPILQAIQTRFRYLPDEALRRVCELTEITPAQIFGVSSFYAQFRRSPVGAHVVRVCHGTACHVAGARQITEELRRRLAIPDGEDTDPGRMFTVDEVACLGCCSLAPVMMIDGHTAGKLTPSAACATLHAIEPGEPA